jgi:hypothetical protein
MFVQTVAAGFRTQPCASFSLKLSFSGCGAKM